MINKQPNILKKAIKQLELKKVPDGVWGVIESNLKQENLLGQSISNLNKKPAPGFIWESIEEELDKKNSLKLAIDELPKRVPEEGLFEEIVLQKVEGTKRKKQITWIAGIAASLTLVLLSVLTFETNNDHQIGFTEEVLESSVYSYEPLKFEHDEVLAFIESNCNVVAVKCNSPKFKGLYDLYLELGNTQKQLQEEANDQYEVASLMEYIIATEKERTEIGKQLIYMIMS